MAEPNRLDFQYAAKAANDDLVPVGSDSPLREGHQPDLPTQLILGRKRGMRKSDDPQARALKP